MKNVHPLPELIESQAAQWLLRLDETTQLDQLDQLNQELAVWLAQSELHQETFEKMSTLWQLADELPETALAERAPKFDSVTNERKPKTTHWFIGFAASFACAIVAYLMYQPIEHKARVAQVSTEAKELAFTRFKSQKQQSDNIILSDNSKVILAPYSEILVQYEVSKRVIHIIKGEAIFDVAKDANRPFSVTDGNRTATALGTVFNVKLGLEALVVSVLEGSVRVANQHVNTLVKAGSYTRVIENGSEPLVQTKLNHSEMTSNWQRQRAEFVDAPLAEVVFDLSRYSDINIYLASQDISELRYTGTVHFDKVEQWLESVALLYGLELQINGNVRVLNVKQE